MDKKCEIAFESKYINNNKVTGIKEFNNKIYGTCPNCRGTVSVLSNRKYCGDCGTKLIWGQENINKQDKFIELDFTESLKDEDWYDDYVNHE